MFDSKTCDKLNNLLNNLGSNTFILGGEIRTNIENDPLVPTLSQTGNCVILRSCIVDYPVKIRDNAIISESSQCSGNIIIKDNVIILRTSIAPWADDDDFHEYNNVIIQDNSVILNSSILYNVGTSSRIAIQNYTYLDNVSIQQTDGGDDDVYNDRSFLSFSGYTHLENISICCSPYCKLRIHNTAIIGYTDNDRLVFCMNSSSCTLTGITIDMRNSSKEERSVFFEKNNIKDADIIANNNVVCKAYGNIYFNSVVLLDDFINEFAG